MSWFIRLILASFCVATLGSIAARDARADTRVADTRVALIVGNAKYEHAGVLANAVNDAMAVSSLLKKAGFDVEERDNLGVVEFKRAVRDFARTAANADIAVVYYSGYGVEFDGINFLIPADAKLANDYDVVGEAIPLDQVIAATHVAKKLSLIILDACTENPFLRAEGGMTLERPQSKGLAPVKWTGTNTLVAYAAKAGSVSFDGGGANSLFTTALVKYIANPGLDIKMALGMVRDEVLAITGNQQEPFVYGSLGETDIFLVPAPWEATLSHDSQDPDIAAASDYELAERAGSRQAWQDFLAAHDSGFYASLARARLLLPIETKLPPIEAKPPQIEAKPPQIEAKPPQIEAKLSLIEPKLPPIEPKPPQIEAKPPQIEAKLPPIETELPPIEPKPPQIEAKPPLIEANLPPIEAKLPPIEAKPPPIETKPPPIDTKLTPIEAKPPPIDTKLTRIEATKPAVAALETPNKAGPPSAGPSLRGAQPPAGVIESVTMTPEQACKSDAVKLAALRLNPSPDQVAKFSSALTCEDLRPQVERFMESLGTENPDEQKNAALEAPNQGEASDREQSCKRESEELTQLRADPIRENAARFARDLKCEDLRPQVERFMESLGTENRADQRSAALEAPSKREASDRVEICKRESGKLSRLRADPIRENAARFAHDLKCEDLRPQVERLMESLGVENPTDQRSAALEAPNKREASDRVEICKRESKELSRLRANPIRENAVRFARDLHCEDLNAQVTRLLESIGD